MCVILKPPAILLLCSVITSFYFVDSKPVDSNSSNYQDSTFSLPNWSLYSKSEILLSSAEQILKNCPFATVFKYRSPEGFETTGELVVYKLSKTNLEVSDNENRRKIVVLAGEHGKDLISSELVVNWLKTTCEYSGQSSEYFKALLSYFDVYLIPIVNLYSRKQVELGDTCSFLNVNQVDIHINWGERKTNAPEIYDNLFEQFFGWQRGRRPFSEMETIRLYQLVKEWAPIAFVCLQSGDESIIVPEDVGEFQTDISQRIREKVCPTCKVGTYSRIYGDQRSTSAIEYISSRLHVPYTYVWKMFQNHSVREDACWWRSNPSTKEDYDAVIQKWTNAFLMLVSYILKAIETTREQNLNRHSALVYPPPQSTLSQKNLSEEYSKKRFCTLLVEALVVVIIFYLLSWLLFVFHKRRKQMYHLETIDKLV